MRTLSQIATLLALVITVAACGSSNKDAKGELTDKKNKVQKLKDERNKLDEDIKKLEIEIAKLDPNAVKAAPKLVATATVQPGEFVHYIDLQGMITTENIYYVSPRGQGGQVKAIYVKEGQPVRKGQLVVKLDDAIYRQQIEQAKIQLAYLKDIYERRKNLWDQNIGTEVELISARTNVTNAEKQIQLLNEQLSTTNVYAEVSGIAEQVNLRVGEFFSPASASQAGIRIVNRSNLKATVNIPENYISRVSQGAPVVVEVPDVNKKINTTISLISQVISPSERGFTAEAKVPSDPKLKPNQIAMVRIQDYKNANAITVPLNIIQNDEKGKFVMVAVNDGGKKVARKKPVIIGELYQERIEVKSGLSDGDEIITDGFQSIYEGQQLTTQVK
jgi:membrane fusion protein, multidrug efflux system